MTEAHKLIQEVSKAYIDKALKRISKIEHKRHSLPKIKLSELEFDILVALAQGRSKSEIENAIKLVNSKFSYHSVVHVLMFKFEAFNLCHLVAKAATMGLFDGLSFDNDDISM